MRRLASRVKLPRVGSAAMPVAPVQTHSGVFAAPASIGPSWRPAPSDPWVSRHNALTAVDFETVHGEVIPEVHLTWEQWGDPSLPSNRTVLLMPSFSHGPHVAASLDDPSPGWWDGIVGPGKAIDTNHFRVLCFSALGSPLGSTNPASLDPRTGKQYRAAFPQLTPADMARAHAMLCEQLGLGRLHAVVGASMGGMQALQFASLFPERVDRLVAIATTPKTTPGSVALRRIQRNAIMGDPAWQGGDYADDPASPGPVAGLRVARELGMFVYRSRQEFDRRFSWAAGDGRAGFEEQTFEVESYLDYAGRKFSNSGFDANSYLMLSKCMDLMDLSNPQLFPGRTLASAAADIAASTLLVGIKQDMITPASELAALEAMMRASGAPGGVSLHILDSEFGHDAFLKEAEVFGPLIQRHMEAGIEVELRAEAQHTTGLSHP